MESRPSQDRFDDQAPTLAAAAPTQMVSAPATGTRRVLVLGLGNDILSDDSVGLRVVQQARPLLASESAVTVQETCEMGLSLLDFIAGYQEVILVDAVQTHQAPPGHWQEIDADELKTLPQMSPHFLGVGEVLSLGRVLGLAMPARVRIFAIEVSDPFTVNTELTAAVKQVVPRMVERVVQAAQAAARGGLTRPSARVHCH